jgi:uncharacterized protein Yka (UPF0111/DUF47 family)
VVDTPGKPFPVLSDKTRLSFSVGTFIAVIGAVIGGVVWLTTLANNVNEMKAQISHIERDVDSIKNHLYTPKVSINP